MPQGSLLFYSPQSTGTDLLKQYQTKLQIINSPTIENVQYVSYFFLFFMTLSLLRVNNYIFFYKISTKQIISIEVSDPEKVLPLPNYFLVVSYD